MILHYFHCQSQSRTFADGNDNKTEERNESSTNASITFRGKLGHVMKATESAGHADPSYSAGRATTTRKTLPAL